MFFFTKARSRPRGPVLKVQRREERRENLEAREALVARLAPALVDVFDDWRVGVDQGRLEATISSGLLTVDSAVLGIDGLEVAMAEAISPHLEDAIAAGGQIGLRFSGVEGVDIDPQRITIAGRAWLEFGDGAARVTRVTQDTKRTVGMIVSDVLGDAISPSQAAKDIGRAVGLTPIQANALRRFEAAQIAALVDPADRALAQAVVGPRGGLGVLRGVDTQLAREAVGVNVERYRDRLLRQRGTLIAETEVQNAILEGETLFWQESIRAGLVEEDTLEKTWFTVQDARVCQICAPLHGKTIPFTDSFSSLGFTGLGPPAHPRCRCYLTYEPVLIPQDEAPPEAGALLGVGDAVDLTFLVAAGGAVAGEEEG